ncbi:MAG: hypothetical protein CVU48_03595 [Candidatus Cloacimonetes bacterium HGW-Cloacimonetes-1]|nr:MAG: hypothetical protein CVU48_03595 [Candidatus Cloacimonetes bacterium HGW-Cloacimonetes-1]
MYDTNGSNDIAQLVQKLGMTVDLSTHQSLELKDDLVWSDYILTGNKQKLYNRLALLHRWQNYGFTVRSSYFGTAFDNAEMTDINLNPNSVNFIKYRNRFMHQANLTGKYELGFLALSSYAYGRRMYSDPTLVYSETSVVLEKINDDLYAGAEVVMKLPQDISCKIGVDLKQHVGGSYFDRTTTHVGIGIEKDILSVFNLFAATTIYNSNQPDYRDILTNQVVSELRLGHRIVPELAGFVSYINRSCFADPGEDIYLLANYLRAHLQYSMPYDLSACSYILAGVKSRPENLDAFHPSNTAYFLETDFKLGCGLYLGGNMNLMKEYRDEYSGKLTYHFNPISEVHVQMTQYDSNQGDPANPYRHTSYTIGTQMRF